ncbi:MAG TPA: hypothetical protein VE783_10435 [Candidatus Limnocylindrales bacterium]|nr:hypothetical protein [Candidatus Limnocylindrales bacterium]
MVTSEEHARLWNVIQNPPAGSKVEAAKKFGIDLTLNLRALQMTPTERVRATEQALAFCEDLRAAMLKPKAQGRSEELDKQKHGQISPDHPMILILR